MDSNDTIEKGDQNIEHQIVKKSSNEIVESGVEWKVNDHNDNLSDVDCSKAIEVSDGTFNDDSTILKEGNQDNSTDLLEGNKEITEKGVLVEENNAESIINEINGSLATQQFEVKREDQHEIIIKTLSSKELVESDEVSNLTESSFEKVTYEKSIDDVEPCNVSLKSGNKIEENTTLVLPETPNEIVAQNQPPVSLLSPERSKQGSIYHLKWFEWKGEQTPIVTQNENGPCPLLAIANVLILARKITLPQMQQVITGKQLMEYIGDCILSEAPNNEEDDELTLNYEQNMQDAIAIMYKLQSGIDVNVRFTGVTDFEYTSECIVFDLLKIVLYHGWLVDPQDMAAVDSIQNLTYNQIVEKMITSKENTEEDVTQGLIIEDFLSRTASQLTYYGLSELNSTIQEEELCVFFRNNHFSTLYKHRNELFLLVTDQGFLTEPAVVWETLNNVENDGYFVNSEFKTVTLESQGNYPSPSKETTNNSPGHQPTASGNIEESTSPTHDPIRSMSQEDSDYLIALSLQQEGQSNDSSNEEEDADLKLAMKLQEEENRLMQQEQLQQQQQQQQQHRQNRNPNTPHSGDSPQHRQQQRQSQSHRQQQRNVSQTEQSDDKNKCIIM